MHFLEKCTVESANDEVEVGRGIVLMVIQHIIQGIQKRGSRDDINIYKKGCMGCRKDTVV